MSKKPSRQTLRHNARRHAVQALYQWHFTRELSRAILDEFMAEHDFSETDADYFCALVEGVVAELEAIETQLSIPLNRKITEIDPVELSVLRLAVYELMYRLDIPYRVIINEALELNKEFGSDQGYKYVNGVLDAVLPKVRDKM